MDNLIREMQGVVARETDRAVRIYGASYASDHEGYGVLAEEIDEAVQEAVCVASEQLLLLRAIRSDDHPGKNSALEEIRAKAILAACEYAQVAAVASKMLRIGTHEQGNEPKLFGYSLYLHEPSFADLQRGIAELEKQIADLVASAGLDPDSVRTWAVSNAVGDVRLCWKGEGTDQNA